MTTFLSLPAELRLSIAEALSPDDAFHFATINKDMWQLCNSLITTHRNLVPKYRSVCPEPNGYTIWNLLNDLTDMPRIADYVLEFELEVNDNYYWDPRRICHGETPDSLARPPPSDVARYIHAADNNVFLRTPVELGRYIPVTRTSEDLHRSIGAGCIESIIPIVLNRLHALQTLRLVPCQNHSWFNHALEGMTAACADPVHSPAPTGLFQQLRKVQLSHWDTELCIGWDWAVFFTRLPSLEYFSAHMVGGGLQPYEENRLNLPDYCKPAKVPTSNLKRLLFSGSMISAEAVSFILSNCKALETFEYEAGGASISWDVEYDPRGFMTAILQYCAHSLERLILENDTCESIQELDRGIHPIPYLCKMAKLKVLRCQYGDLVDNPGDKQCETMFDPHILFPSTLECLHVDQAGSFDDHLKRSRLLEILLETKKHALPNLAQICVGAAEYSNQRYMDANLAARATEQGLQYAMIERETESIYYKP